MARVNVRKGEDAASPSAEIVKAASQVSTSKDSLGRMVGVRKLGALQRMRMLEVIGADLSLNQIYLGQAMIAASVCNLDGEDVPFPRSKRELEALVERLGDEGLMAAGKAIADLMGVEVAEDGKIVEKAKN